MGAARGCGVLLDVGAGRREDPVDVVVALEVGHHPVQAMDPADGCEVTEAATPCVLFSGVGRWTDHADQIGDVASQRPPLSSEP